MSNVNEHDTITAATNTADTKTSSSEAASSEADIWQLNALTEALGDLSLTVIDSLSVGRGNDNDVVLGSKQVSRNHALLSVLNGKLYVKDLGSSNGTFINDDRVEDNKSKHLKADDTVGFASFAFKVTTALAPTDSKPSIAEDASLVAAADTLVTEPTPTADTDVTYIGAIDTGVITNEDVHTEVVNAEVVDSDGVDSSVLDTTIMDAEITDVEVIEDIALPTATVDKELENKALESFEDFTTDAVTPAAVAEPEELLEVQPSVSSPVEAVVVEETVLDNNGLNHDIVDNTTAEEAVIHHNNAEHVVIEGVVSEDVVIENIAAPVVENAIIKETIIEDVLSSTERQAHALVEEPQVTPTLLATPSVADEDEPVISHENPEILHEEIFHEKILHEELVADKTRVSEAVEIEKPVTNPATTGHVEKKSSGGLFIWVFIAIIIIGLALWLFNV